MSLALAPDNIDRYGDHYGDHSDYDLDDDDHHIGSHLPFAKIGTVSDTAQDGNNTLAGIDEITALKWKYEDKMVTMGLVFGSAILIIVFILVGLVFHRRIARKVSTPASDDKSGEGGCVTWGPRKQRFLGTHAYPPPLYHGNQSIRDITNGNKARTETTTLNHEQPLPSSFPPGSTILTEASSEDISTVSSFERFMTSPTPPPFTEDSVTVSRPLHKSTGPDSPLPAYTADAAVGVKSEKSLASPQLDTPAPIFLQPVRPGIEDTPAPVPAPQDSVAPTLDLRVPYDQWRFGV